MSHLEIDGWRIYLWEGATRVTIRHIHCMKEQEHLHSIQTILPNCPICHTAIPERVIKLATLLCM